MRPLRSSRACSLDRTYCRVVTSIEVPDVVRRTALSHGEAGAQWLRDLPAIVEELERRWGITVGATFAGGTAACVAAATTADGAQAVVKIAMPATVDGDEVFERSVVAFGLADGRGCARLLAHDGELSALLIEAFGPKNLDRITRSKLKRRP